VEEGQLSGLDRSDQRLVNGGRRKFEGGNGGLWTKETQTQPGRRVRESSQTKNQGRAATGKIKVVRGPAGRKGRKGEFCRRRPGSRNGHSTGDKI